MSKLKALALLGLMAASVPSCSSNDGWDYSASYIYVDGQCAYSASNVSNLAYKEDSSKSVAVLHVRYDVRTAEHAQSGYTVTSKYVGHPYRIVRKTT